MCKLLLRAPKSTKRSAKEAAPLIIAAMEKIEQEDEWYALGALGANIIAANSDFDSRAYGHKKLSDLVRSLNQFETRRDGLHLYVRKASNVG